MRRALATVALLLAAAGTWWLWPATLGGRTTYLVTEGTSMAPRFGSGDLAVVRTASRYTVGDVVAYRSSTLHAVVLHRIEGLRDGRFVLQGDHNAWLDPDEATADEIVGRLVGRVPQGGRWLTEARRPPVIGVAGVLGALLGVALRAGRAGARSRRGPPPRRAAAHATRGTAPLWTAAGTGTGVARRPDAGKVLPGVVTATACAGVGLLSLGTLAWVLPASRAGTQPVGWSQSATLGYVATAPRGPAFPTGEVVTGDPVFLALSPTLDVVLEYRATADGPHRFAGTCTLSAVVSTANGWSGDVPLLAPAAFDGDGFRTRARLDLRGIPARIRAVEAASGVPVTGYTVTVRADLRPAGTVAGQAVQQPLTTSLAFDMDDRQLRLVTARDGAHAPGDPVVVRWSGSVRRPTTTATELSLGGLQVRTASLRRPPLEAGLALLAFCALLAAWAGAAGTRRREERSGLGPHLLRTGPVAARPERTVVDVDSLAELVRVAERYERFVLASREAGPDGRLLDGYWVDDGAVLYRFVAADSAADADPGADPGAALGRLLTGIPAPRRPAEAGRGPVSPVGERVQAFVDGLRRPDPPRG